jgi:hypothetical protein
MVGACLGVRLLRFGVLMEESKRKEYQPKLELRLCEFRFLVARSQLPREVDIVQIDVKVVRFPLFVPLSHDAGVDHPQGSVLVEWRGPQYPSLAGHLLHGR